MNTTNILIPVPRQTARRRGFPFHAVAALALLAAACVWQRDRVRHFFSPKPAAAAAAQPEAPAGRAVNLVTPTVSNAPVELTLPAQLLPYEQTSLYARVDGYVARWHADRGAKVKAGELLAEIDAPELDQQLGQAEAALQQGKAAVVQAGAELEQARAELEQTRAQVKLAEANKAFAVRESVRSRELVTRGSVSRSEHDSNVRNQDVTDAQINAARADVNAKEKLVASRQAAISAREATVQGLEADVRWLRELQGFKRIVAPFDGTVTRRGAEVGMLVTANSAAGQELFHVQQSSTLRVQVDVPQGFAQQARASKTGDVLVPELPGKPLPARVARTANALDPATRTLRVELELPNPGRAVLPGTYAQVRFSAAPTRPAILVPAAALLYTARGTQVAAVENGRVAIRPVTLGRDYGKSVEVVGGLSGGEQLVTNPTDDLKTGEPVRVAGVRPADANAVAMANQWPARTTK